MISRSHIFVLMLGLATMAHSQVRNAIVAEGTYGKRTADSSEAPSTLVRWTMTRDVKQNLRLTIRSDKSNGIFTSASEEYLFTSAFHLLSHSLEADQERDGRNIVYSYSCKISDDIDCRFTSDGIPQQSSVKVGTPYLLVGAEQFQGDILFAFAAMLTSVPHTAGKSVRISTIGIDEDSKDFKMKILEEETVEYVGQEEITLAIGKLRANVFKLGDMTFWTARSGLLLAEEQRLNGEESLRIELTSIEGAMKAFLLNGD